MKTRVKKLDQRAYRTARRMALAMYRTMYGEIAKLPDDDLDRMDQIVTGWTQANCAFWEYQLRRPILRQIADERFERKRTAALKAAPTTD